MSAQIDQETPPSEPDEVAHFDPYLDYETQEALQAEDEVEEATPPKKRRKVEVQEQPEPADLAWDDESETEADEEDPGPGASDQPPWRAGQQKAYDISEGPNSMANTLRSLLPSNSFQALVEQAQHKVQATAERHLGLDARVKTFGSMLQGTFLEGSDLDLYIVRVLNPDALQNHKQQVAALRKMDSSLPLQGFEVKERRYDWHVRVPILILTYRSGGHELQVDISMGEADHEDVEKGQVDRLIQTALRQTPMALPMVLLVKRWAKIEGLNKSFEGNLSPLAWTLLCLFFLIRKGLLPSDALAVPSREPAPKREPQELCTNCPAKEDLADFFSMVCTLGRRTRKSDEGPCGVALLPAKECRGEVNDKALFFVEDPAARSIKDRMVNVARGVKDPSKWEHLLRRCEGASAVLKMPHFNTDTFFRKRIVVSGAKAIQPKAIQPKAIQPKANQPKANQPKANQPKAIQPKAMPRPPQIPPKARPKPAANPTQAVPMMQPTAKNAPKPPQPKAQPKAPQAKAQPKAQPKQPAKANSVLKVRHPAPLKPGVSRPIPRLGVIGAPPPEMKRRPQAPQTPPRKEGHPKQSSWGQEQRSAAVIHPWQVDKRQAGRDQDTDGRSKWKASSYGSDRWKSSEGNDDRQRNDSWQRNGQWQPHEQNEQQGQQRQRWQRTTWRV